MPGATLDENTMDQMNVSVTDHIAGYVRKKVQSGRYNNASGVVREALRRMEDDDQRILRLAKPTVEDILTNLGETEIAGIRQRVRTGLDSIERGDFTEYDGIEGLQELAASIKAKGRRAIKHR